MNSISVRTVRLYSSRVVWQIVSVPTVFQHGSQAFDAAQDLGDAGAVQRIDKSAHVRQTGPAGAGRAFGDPLQPLGADQMPCRFVNLVPWNCWANVG
jgi:hypothetical protein